MYILFGLGLAAFGLCLMFTLLCRNLALHLNLVDKPDAERKLHGRPIPRVGGVAIVLAYVGALGLVFAFAPRNEAIYIQHRELLWSLLPAAGIVFLTGLLDDLVGLKPSQKLAGQLIAALLAVGLGTRIQTENSSFFLHHPGLATPWFVIPLSLIWLIGCTNAVNLIDGLDGLAAGVGLFATITTLIAAVFSGNAGLILATMPLAGCLLGFLCFNFNPASIFLGDCGSLTIGFVLGCFGLVWSQRGGTMLGLAAPLMVLALPAIDVALAICRRYIRRVPIFKGDRGHIHHMVLARGFHPRTTALILYGVCAIAASLALLQSFSTSYLHTAVIAIFFLLVWSGVNYLDYIELGAARRAVSGRRFFRHVRDEIYLHEIDRSFSQAQTGEGCWNVVQKVCVDMHFDGVQMRLQDAEFGVEARSNAADLAWNITLPLGGNDYLALTCKRGEERTDLVMPAIERLHKHLSEKVLMLPISSGGLKQVPKRTMVMELGKESDAA